MSSTVRKIEQPAPRRHDWRSATADALEAVALVLDSTLDRIGEAEEMLEGWDKTDAIRAGNAAAAHYRTIRNDFIDEADRLRAAVKTAQAVATGHQ